MNEITHTYIDHLRSRMGRQIYRKKPLSIEAYQIEKSFVVETLEGMMKGKAGDYVIVGINNELYICDKDIFNKSYDFIENREE